MPPTPDAPSGPQRQHAILLPGFDYDEQLMLEFHAPSFNCMWLRRTYTDEAHPKIQYYIDHLHGKTPESLLREVRYGNNITLLFRACSACRRYLDSPDYWAAVGSGFAATADQVRHVVDIIVRARKIYLDHSVDAGPRSATTAAVDQWIYNLEHRITDNAYRPTANRSVFEATSKYYADAKTKFLQVDSANMLLKPLVDEPRKGRKRSPSPTFTGPSRSAKRRPSETSFERRPLSLATASLPLPSPNSNRPELRILGGARQPYRTPISANKGTRHGDHDSRGRSPDMADRIPMRGRARRDSFDSPSFRPPSRGANSKSESINGDLEQAQAANGLLRDRVEKLDKRLAAMMAQPRKDDASDELEKRLAMFEQKLAFMESRPAAMESVPPFVKAVLASIEERMIQAEERRIKDMEKAQAMIASFESRLSVTGSEESNPKQAEVIRDLQSRIASLETKLDMTGGHPISGSAPYGEQTQIIPLDKRVTVAEAQLKEKDAPVEDDVAQRQMPLEDRLLPAHDSAHAKWHINDMSAKITRVEARLTLHEAVTKDIKSRLSSLDEQHLESSKLAASKTFVEMNSKKLNDRLSILEKKEREVDEYKAGNNAALKVIEDRVVALEDQGVRPLNTLETPKTTTEPPPQGVQHNMEDVWKKIKGLPTMTSVSEKTFQIEQNLRALLEQYQRNTNERLASAVKDLSDSKAQIKGLLKLLDEATSGMAKSDSVTAIESELAILSRRVDTASQSNSRNADIEKLEDRVAELGNDVQQALRAVSSADMAAQLQEIHHRVDAIGQGVEVAKLEDLATTVASLHDHCNTLTACLKELLCEFTRVGR